MCGLPLNIEDGEKIVRAIMCPSHVKNGKLKPAAFRSKAGTDDVSVIRHTHMASDFCKEKAQEIAANSHVNDYAGLAVLTAGSIRQTGSEVHDSREEFCGHAHISHGIVLPPGEPPESESFVLVTERCRDLLKVTIYHADLNPMAQGWSGPEI